MNISRHAFEVLYYYSSIAEQAGRKVTNGFEHILDIIPSALHQRAPFFCDSTEIVKKKNYLF